MKFDRSLAVVMLIFFVFSLTSWTNIAPLEKERVFDSQELEKIRSRYPAYKNKGVLFNKTQIAIIKKKNLAPIIAPLILHKQIKLSDGEQLIDFAQEIKDSGFLFTDLQVRINRYIHRKYLPFLALRKAIEREQFHSWKIKRNEQVRETFGPFLQRISALDLHQIDQEKIINAYAVCIDSYRHKKDREFLRPTVCDRRNEYPTPRGARKNISVRDKPASSATTQVIAYRDLITQAKNVAREKNLSTFERVMMGKCIAEQSLRFFEPLHHPFKALKKTRSMDQKSPEKAFFMNTGVCGNFSGIAYNIVNQLELNDGEIMLSRFGLHIYVEFRKDDKWYHTHPFNKIAGCDIIKFSDND